MHVPDPSEPPAPRALRAVLDDVLRDVMAPVAIGLGLIYALFSLGHVFLLPPHAVPVLVPAAATTALLFLGLGTVYLRRPLPARTSYPVAAGVAMVVLANCLLHFAVVPEPRNATNLLLLVLGAGAFFLRGAWLAAVVGATLAGFAGVVATAPPAADWPHFGFALCAAAILAELMRRSRQRAYYRLVALRERDRATREVLERAMTAAQAGERAKTEFLATMSHEIRTPMHGVIGFLDMLADTPLDGEQREYVDTVRRCAANLLALLNDVLDLSKLEAGMVRLEHVPFDLRRLLEEVADLLALSAEQKGLELVLDYPWDVPSALVGDPSRLRQIALNLAGNAVKFTEAGRVRLAVDGRVAAPGTAAIRLSVEDTGIGIAPDDQHRLFEKFTQADASTTRRFGGTGLGLAICRQLAALMGGTIGLRSAPGEGSTFFVDLALPLVAEPDGARELPLERRASGSVLVGDDDPVIRLVLRRQLEALGFGVTTVTSGGAVLDAVAADRYTAVLVDTGLQDVDGCALVAELRRRETRGAPRVPVIGLLAWESGSQRDRCLAAGMDAVLVKPVTRRALGASLARYAGGDGGAGRLAAAAGS